MVGNNKDIGAQESGNINQEKLSPSSLLRELRPEYYSDSSVGNDYELDQSMFEYHLETLTSRNEPHDFEIFCRKLCERVICPNLRPATGPEGGGDSKADTETYTVSDEIMQMVYIGKPNAGSERWAFAFSTKKRWKEKVRSDIEGLVRTGRNYDHIIFVTSQFARARTRSDLEDELAKKYNIPIEIHDRSWIVKEIIEENRKDLAVAYLKVGKEVPSRRRMGPTDCSRHQQLGDIEEALSNLDTYKGMEIQAVAEALTAAKISRGLEHPRTEIEGRFARAKRLAEKYGTHRQQLEIVYETILTAFWWYDDIEFLNSSYEEFERMLLSKEHVKNVEFLFGLMQLLVNCVVHDHLTVQESKFAERNDRLDERLHNIVKDQDRPNSALTAETLILHMKLNKSLVLGEKDQLSEIWHQLSDVLDRAKAMAEFDVEGLVKLIHIAGNIAGNDPSYTSLVENTAAFVAARTGEGEGARILVQRAEQLDSDQHFEIIRLLGKASRMLAKKEYTRDLIKSLNLLALAYRSAGLLWASRATCLAAASMIVVESETSHTCDVSIIFDINLWAWLSLELHHIPDLLCASELLISFIDTMPLEKEAQKQLAEECDHIDLVLASHLLNYSESDIGKLALLPNKLQRIPLNHARVALLYSLGYGQLLLDECDGELEGEISESLSRFCSTLASQAQLTNMQKPLVCNSSDGQIFEARILGLKVRVSTEGSVASILLAEMVLGVIEVFLATLPDLNVSPHTERFNLDIVEKKEIKVPEFQLDPDEMRGKLIWPTDKNPSEFDLQPHIIRCLTRLSGEILGITCFISNFKKIIGHLYNNEFVMDRVAMLVGTSNSYGRIFNRPLSRLSDHVGPDDKPFSSRGKREVVVDKKSNNQEQVDINTIGKNHRDLDVRSIINIHLWDRAKWRGTAFFHFAPDQPPLLALMFENEEAARKIFTQWQEQFGNRDVDEIIYIGFIKDISPKNSSYYKVLVTTNFPPNENKMKHSSTKLTVYPGRYLTVTPDTSVNLSHFLDQYQRVGSYGLIPAIYKDNKAEPIMDRVILKRRLTVKSYADIGPHDIESMASPSVIHAQLP